MTTSDQIDQIATALAKAQGAMRSALKDSANPFFKSKYADLASVWDACRKPLADNGLAVLQSPSAEGVRVTVVTLLTHASGQWIRGEVSVSAKEDTPQAVGSCITYLRRYALQSFAGVAPEDDDAEAAHGRSAGSSAPRAETPKPPDGFEDWWLDMTAVADTGQDALRKAWEASDKKFRAYVSATNPKGWQALKDRAADVDRKAVA